MALRYIDKNILVGHDRGDGHLLELLKKTESTSKCISLSDARVLLGMKGIFIHYSSTNN